MPVHLRSTALGLLLAGTVTIAEAGEPLGGGAVLGASGHDAGGGAVLEQGPGGLEIRFDRAFRLDGPGRPVVGLARDGVLDPATVAGPLEARSGAQAYALPEDVDPDDYDEIVIWCLIEFEPLALAPLAQDAP